MSMLEQIINTKEKEIRHLKSTTDKTRFPLNSNSFVAHIKRNKINLICEMKPKSPIQGVLVSDTKIDKYIKAYNNHASAISVLTDSQYFGGGYELLNQIRNSTTLPILQKDFILNPKQIDLGYTNGASAVLLIVKILKEENLKYLIEYTNNLNLTPVVEINNKEELHTAITCGAEVVLINNRNLDTFEVDLNTTKFLAPLIPEDIISISASGYSKVKEIEEARGFVNAFLIGTTLMKSQNPNNCLELYLGKSTISM